MSKPFNITMERKEIAINVVETMGASSQYNMT